MVMMRLLIAVFYELVTKAMDVTVGRSAGAVLKTVTVVICGIEAAVDRTVTVGAAAVTVAIVEGLWTKPLKMPAIAESLAEASAEAERIPVGGISGSAFVDKLIVAVGRLEEGADTVTVISRSTTEKTVLASGEGD